MPMRATEKSALNETTGLLKRSTLGMSRRGLLQACTVGIGASALVGCGPYNNPKDGTLDHKQFYRYQAKLKIDGHEYDFENGGVLGIERGIIAGSPFRDYAMPATARLKSGETAVVFPPSLLSAWELLAAGSPLKELPYPSGAYPKVFIFDDASKPSLVRGWITRAGVVQSDRVQLMAIKNEIASTDVRKSVAGEFPWYAPLEQARRVVTDGGQAEIREFGKLYLNAFNGAFAFGSVHAMLAPVASILPAAYPKPLSRPMKPLILPKSYLNIGEAIAGGRQVHLPLRRIVVGVDVSFGWSSSPLEFDFQPIVGDEQLSAALSSGGIFSRIRGKQMTAGPLGELRFAPDPKSEDIWISQTGEFRMLINYLPLIFLGHAVYAGSGGDPEYSITP